MPDDRVIGLSGARPLRVTGRRPGEAAPHQWLHWKGLEKIVYRDYYAFPLSTISYQCGPGQPRLGTRRPGCPPSQAAGLGKPKLLLSESPGSSWHHDDPSQRLTLRTAGRAERPGRRASAASPGPAGGMPDSDRHGSGCSPDDHGQATVTDRHRGGSTLLRVGIVPCHLDPGPWP
jgi:hypothetical protein